MSTAVKILLGILILIIIAVGVSFGVAQYLVSKLDGTGNPPAQSTADLQPYGSEDGYSFMYPDTYELSGGSESGRDVLVLLPKGYNPPVNGEGPPSITIAVFHNVTTPLEQWIRTVQHSNFDLSDGQLAQTTVDGEEAFAYRHSGLYESDAVAVKHDDMVLLFSAGWNSPTDKTRSDLTRILETVEFH